MRQLTADYVFPASRKPIPNGVVITDDEGVIQEVTTTDEVDSQKKLEKFSGVLTPGFINTHTHLELSHLKKKIEKGKGMANFILQLLDLRDQFEEEVIKEAVATAEQEMVDNGIVGVGDIANTIHSFSQKQKGKLRYHTFVEVMNLDPAKADEVIKKGFDLLEQVPMANHASKSLVPHAPYSASEDLLSKLDAFAHKYNYLLSIHMKESTDEDEFMESKTGELKKVYEKLNIDITHFNPTEKSALKNTLNQLSKDNRLMLVHNTFLRSQEIKWARHHFDDLWFCFCPNSNLHITGQLPDIDKFVKQKVRICIGTDSLAANDTLSVLEELKTIADHYPDIPLQKLIAWGTMNGAKYLRFDDTLGSLAKGKQPGVNLIKNVDLDNLQLTADSEVERII